MPVMGVGSFRLSAFLQRGLNFSRDPLHPERSAQAGDLLPSLQGSDHGGGAGCCSSSARGLRQIEPRSRPMIDHRNELTTGHVLTFEDPIEFLFRNKKSIINQREIGSDALELRIALKNAMRQGAGRISSSAKSASRDDGRGTVVRRCRCHLVVATMHATNSSHRVETGSQSIPPKPRAMFQTCPLLEGLIFAAAVRSTRADACRVES